MQTGAVGFHTSKYRKLRRTDRDRGQVKRLEKTRREAHPDLQAQKLQFEREVIAFRKERDRLTRSPSLWRTRFLKDEELCVFCFFF